MSAGGDRPRGRLAGALQGFNGALTAVARMAADEEAATRAPEPPTAAAIAPPSPPAVTSPAPSPAPAAAPPTRRPRSAMAGRSATWVAGLCLVASLGLLTTAIGHALSREGREGAEPLFWTGYLLIVLPAAARLASRSATRTERACIVAGLGLVLYLSKVIHDPFAFTFSDELLHLRNAEDVLREGALFPQNSILPVTVYYPGLASLTAALAQATGLSLFPIGLIVIGAGRLLMMLAIFLLVERLAGSSRLAGIGALVYVANPNFLFWSGQYSYQSLALPLALLAAAALAGRSAERDPIVRQGWSVVAMLAVLAVVMTHHLTGYALAALFLVVSVAPNLGFGRRGDTAWGLAAFTVFAAIAWLVQVAPLSGDYLTQIFSSTFDGVLDTVRGGGETRTPFVSAQGVSAPPWERIVGLASVVLLALAMPPGLLRAWRRRSRSALMCVLAAAGALLIAFVPLRLIPSAWETANRTSDFLFVGVGLVVALSALHLRPRGRRGRIRLAAAVAVFGVIAVGGAIAGWPPDVRTSLPFRAVVGDRTIGPQGVALGEWSLATLGPGHRFVADETNGRMLLTYGLQLPKAGGDGLARTVLEAERVDPTLVSVLRARGVSYVAVDRRATASDNMAGYFFPPAGQPPEGTAGLRSPEQTAVFDRPTSDRIFDSGDIAVYDVRRLLP